MIRSDPPTASSTAGIRLPDSATAITASRKAQEALLESEQMARDIISNALEAFVQTDDAGRILEWNPQAESLFGWPRGEATGQSLASLLLSDDYRSHYRDMHARLMRDGDGATSGERFELEAVAKDGHKVKDRGVLEGPSPTRRACVQCVHKGSHPENRG